MTRAAATGVANTAAPLFAAAASTSEKGATPSAKTTIAGPAAISRAASSLRRAGSRRLAASASTAPMTWMLLGWVKLRWPISAAAAASSRRTAALPPSRPPTQASESASRLSSCSRATLTWSIGLPRGDQLVQRRGVGCAPHRLAQRLVAEHLRELGQDLQVLLGGLLGHEQHEHQRHRVAVGRVEGNRLPQAEERAERVLQALDAPVRDGDALPQAGGAQALAREQAVEDDALGDAVVVLEQEPHLLEQALLARDLHVEVHVRGGQQLGDEAHERRRIIPGLGLLFPGAGPGDALVLAEALVRAALILVPEHLAVELVGEEIDGRIKVLLLARA